MAKSKTSKRIALLVGGWNQEREVSLSTGEGISQALIDLGHDVRVIDVKRDLPSLLQQLDPKPDLVFNALHGRWGEDGALQGVFEILQIPYTHSGILASAAAMDKSFAKLIFKAGGLPVIEGREVSSEEALSGPVLPFPYVLKPTSEGSSVGVFMIHSQEDLKKCDMLKSYKTILAEHYIPGRELSAVVMGDKALGVIELNPLYGFYDYAHKYTDQKTEHYVPARIPEEAQHQVMQIALKAHRMLGCQGITRTDFRYDDTQGEPGKLYILELNTQPGMTPLSLVPDVARHYGISFQEIVQWMVDNARCPQ